MRTPSGLFLVACALVTLAIADTARGQDQSLLEFRDEETGKADRILQKPTDPAAVILEGELLTARRNGNDDRVRQLQEELERRIAGTCTPSGPDLHEVTPLKHTASITHTSPLWGDDITVYQGPLRFSSGAYRELAVASDTTGNIYTAAILAGPDSGSQIAVFKSTDRGFTWSLVNGVNIPSLRYQSFALSVTDTVDGRWVVGLLYVLKPSFASAGGSLLWTSFLDDGTGWRTSTVVASDSLTQYRSPSLTTDGYAYSPASTWHYAAAERISATTGVSRGITAFRSSNVGATWPVMDTTFSFGVEDAFPSIAVQAGVGTGDTVFVAFARKFSPADNDIRLFKNSSTYSGTWSFRAVTTTLTDEFAPSLSVSSSDGHSLITYTRNTGPSTQMDALYVYTTDRWGTLSTGILSGDPGKQEYFTTCCHSRSGTESQWHVSFRVVSDTVTATPDTIIYRTSGDLANLGNTSSVVVNRYQDAAALRPVVGAHRQGPTGTWVGHVVYSLPGPATDILYDGFEIPVSVDVPPPFPPSFSLEQNYPNPFNPTTNFRFRIGEFSTQGGSASGGGLVSLKVFNILGQEVATLVDGTREAGSHTLTFDGSNLAGGVYFYRLTAGSFTAARRMILLK